MQLRKLFKPFELIRGLALRARRFERLRRVRGTVASSLQIGHIDSLELLELLRNRPPRVIYDIGANVGTWTLLAKAIFPKAEVHAFEPMRRHLLAFKKNTERLMDVHLHPVGLGMHKSELTINVTSLSDASSFLEVQPRMGEVFGITKTGDERVPMERLDAYAVEHQLRPPDLIKLDVQGYELEVFRGGLPLLRQAYAVISEVSFEEFYRGQCTFADITKLLADEGFRLHALGENTTIGAPLVQTDALFLRSSSS